MNLSTVWKRCLVAIVLGLLAVPVGAAASSRTQPPLTSAQLHVVAQEASAARELLRIENSFTHEAVAFARDGREPAQRIRARNRILIGLCDSIVHDEARVSAAEQQLRDQPAHAATGPDAEDLLGAITRATEDAHAKLRELAEKKNLTEADEADMHRLTNHISGLNEQSRWLVATSRSVVSAANSMIASMTRNVES